MNGKTKAGTSKNNENENKIVIYNGRRKRFEQLLANAVGAAAANLLEHSILHVQGEPATALGLVVPRQQNSRLVSVQCTHGKQLTTITEFFFFFFDKPLNLFFFCIKVVKAYLKIVVFFHLAQR